MKKTFALKEARKADARVVESVKHEVRKYVTRERRKALPEGFTAWTFSCRVGATEMEARPCELPDLGRGIDDVARAGGAEVYVEILAQPGHRRGDEPVPPASA